MFSDSKLAKKYGAGKTKTLKIIKGEAIKKIEIVDLPAEKGRLKIY